MVFAIPSLIYDCWLVVLSGNDRRHHYRIISFSQAFQMLGLYYNLVVTSIMPVLTLRVI